LGCADEQKLEFENFNVLKSVDLSFFTVVLNSDESFGVGRIFKVRGFNPVYPDLNMFTLAMNFIVIPGIAFKCITSFLGPVFVVVGIFDWFFWVNPATPTLVV
jgi:hypothetical protein